MADKLSVLYVEDEADIRAVTEFALEEGFQLILCCNGQEALDKARNVIPDLLLLDVMMPGIDGPTTLARLREIAGYEHIPAIFMTAKVQPQEVKQLIELGVLGVIPKPFDPLTLADQIHSILKREHG